MMPSSFNMYKKILIPVDNSEHSRCAEHLGVIIGKTSQAKITGLHVYSSQFHQLRFKLLEEHLPDKYQHEEVLDYQRRVHSVLIDRGLELISLEYMKHMKDACVQQGIIFKEELIDGKNADVIIDLAASHDLVILGALGMGAVSNGTRLGSNSRRVVSTVHSDVLITRKSCELKNIVVTIDGSNYSEKIVQKAAQMAKAFDATLTIMTCFDPGLHSVVFKSLTEVLSKQAGKVFKFNEQKQLHNQVIDQSLENLYIQNLEKAQKLAEPYEIALKTELLRGKPYLVISEKLRDMNADLCIVGRFGMHRGKYACIGSTAERIVEVAPTNVLVMSLDNGVLETSAPEEPQKVMDGPYETLIWDDEAKKRLENIPVFARPMAVLAIERYAREHHINLITPEVMMEARNHYE